MPRLFFWGNVILIKSKHFFKIIKTITEYDSSITSENLRKLLELEATDERRNNI